MRMIEITEEGQLRPMREEEAAEFWNEPDAWHPIPDQEKRMTICAKAMSMLSVNPEGSSWLLSPSAYTKYFSEGVGVSHALDPRSNEVVSKQQGPINLVGKPVFVAGRIGPVSIALFGSGPHPVADFVFEE